MEQRDKDEFVARAMRGGEKQRRSEENRRDKERARKRGAFVDRDEDRQKPRRKRWDDDGDADADGDAGFEKITRRVVSGDVPAQPQLRDDAAEVIEGDDSGGPATGRAVVAAVDRDRVEVLTGGELLTAFAEPGLRRSVPGGLAVGDEVELRERQGGELRIEAVGARRSVLSRRDPAKPHRERVLAANVDVAVVTQSVASPPLRPGLIDRLLVALGRGGIAPLVAVNKWDLLGHAEHAERAAARAAAERALAPYRAQGIPCLEVSAETGAGLDDLRRALTGRTCVFVGHSGVGKSSLANALDPDGARATSAVRAFDGKGRHTTSRSTLRVLADGTRIIDTPGIRAFGLAELDRADAEAAFPEISALVPQCRFRDCLHLAEPACRVREAVATGEIAAVRYASYVAMLRS